MAVGQFLDLPPTPADARLARPDLASKTGSYTVEGPLQIGALLAAGR